MTAQTEAPQQAPAAEVGRGAAAQGRRAAHHRPDQLDRQHPAARHAARGLPAEPVRARPHQLGERQCRRSDPGVIAAFSGADFAAEQGSLPCAWPVTPDIVMPAHPPMATDEVRYVGEAVACVVARDRYAAADAWPPSRLTTNRCRRCSTSGPPCTRLAEGA